MNEQTILLRGQFKKIWYGLLVISALSFFAFTILPEFYNGLALDDLIFWNQLKEMNIFQFTIWYWKYWEGTYVWFFEHGIQYNIFGFFQSTLPYALLLYFIEVSLIASSLGKLSHLSTLTNYLFSMLIWGLYLFCLPQISSYYWNCTRGYSLSMAVAVWFIAKIFTTQNATIYDYIKIIFAALLVGCSSPIFAPLILVILGCYLLKLFFNNNANIIDFFKHNAFEFTAFILCTIFFFLEVASPGNWARKGVHSELISNAYQQFIPIYLSGIIQVLKILFFKLHYYIILFLVSISIFINTEEKNTLSSRDFLIKTLYRFLITSALLLLSMFLSEWASGSPFIHRAFAHLPMMLFAIIILTARDLCRTSVLSVRSAEHVFYVSVLCLIFVVCNNVFSTNYSYYELESYKCSFDARLNYLNTLEQQGNVDIVHLEPLDSPEFNAISDVLIRKIVPTYSHIALMPTCEIANSPHHCYNEAFRKYYNFSFDAITDLIWEGV